jgi:FkbM family methyltransferase
MEKPSDLTESSPNLLAKLPILNRLKIVKDFLVGKLDLIEFKLNTVFDNELKNDAQLLEAVTGLAEGLTSLTKAFERVHQKVEFLYSKKVNDLWDPNQAHQVQLITVDNTEPETRLMAYLYSFLPTRKAVDIGANVGAISEKLLEAGFEVYAFEPFPRAFDQLKQRFHQHQDFHAFPLAVGAADETRDFHIAQDLSETKRYRDAAMFNSLTKHAMPEDMSFVDTILVTVRSLERLHQTNVLPADISLLKIDTEGYDLEILRGMGPQRYSVVIAEFWDAQLPFGTSDAFNHLEDMVNEMRPKGYHWYLVIYRIWGNEDVSFYCNYPKSIAKSWGNVFFFQDYDTFAHALKWCLSILDITYVA